MKNKIKIVFFCFITVSILINNKAVKDYKYTNEMTNCNKVTNDVIINGTNYESFINNTSNITNQSLNNEIIYMWSLEIPKINLLAEISEGTSKEVLDQYIGHFEESNKISGNICLAAHNRGYNVNYFGRLKELEIGDEIYYTYNENKKTYIVTSKTIIKDTDLNVLENTKDNRLTLITCVENQPQYRRCIQALEYK